MKNKNKLWQIGEGLDKEVEKYTVGEDYILDQQLLPYDLEASLAHAKMLHKIKIIDSQELTNLSEGLDKIKKLWEKGEFIIKQDQEDGHTAIEQYLTEEYGEVGKKIHTGRSRNDQVLVMLRLYMKDELGKIKKDVIELAEILKEKAEELKDIHMPGYTHTQKAMPTTVGTWIESYKDALEDSLLLFDSTEKIIDQSPLGSASGFGISNLSLDQEYTANLLKFSKAQKNPMYCGLSRGFFESIILQTFSPIMILLNRLSNDLMLFTTQEFNFFSLPDNMTTGSSIMPQKRNYDLLEILRAKVTVFFSLERQIQDIVRSLISGYHRDLQITKKSFINSIEITKDSVSLVKKIVGNIFVKKDSLENAMTPDLFATEMVYDLVNKGMSFRDAYKKVKEKIKNEFDEM